MLCLHRRRAVPAGEDGRRDAGDGLRACTACAADLSASSSSATPPSPMSPSSIRCGGVRMHRPLMIHLFRPTMAPRYAPHDAKPPPATTSVPPRGAGADAAATQPPPGVHHPLKHRRACMFDLLHATSPAARCLGCGQVCIMQHSSCFESSSLVTVMFDPSLGRTVHVAI